MDTSPPPVGAGGNQPNPNLALVPTVIDGRTTFVPASATIGGPKTTPPVQQSPTLSNVVVTQFTTLPASTPTSQPSTEEGGMPFGTKLAVILVPILVVLALIPIIWFVYVHRRNRKRDRKITSREEKRPPTETQPLRHSPGPSLTLPSPFSDSERIRSGSLGVYDVRQSLEERARSNSLGIGIYDRESNARASSELERGPSPTLPSPSIPTFHTTRTTGTSHKSNDSWPLPATGNLPSPATSYDSQFNRNKPLPKPAARSKPSSPNHQLLPRPPTQPKPASPQLPRIPHIAPLAVPGAAFRPTSSNYEPTPLTASFPSPPRSAVSPAMPNGSSHSLAHSESHEMLNPFHNDPVSNRSSAVSEMSDYGDAPADERRPRNRDTDAISMISNMTRDTRRRSGRDTDAMSVVSALSPDDTRDIHMEHFPLGR